MAWSLRRAGVVATRPSSGSTPAPQGAAAGAPREARLVYGASRTALAGCFARPRVRLATAGAILLGEYLGISLRFDAATVDRRGGLWEVAGELGGLAPLGVVVATALLLLRPRVAGTSVAISSRPRWLAFSAMHLALLAAFYGATLLVFGSAAPPSGPAWFWLGSWAALGVGTAWTLLLAFVTFRAGKRPPAAAVLAGCAVLAAGVAGWSAGNWTLGYWEPLSHATLAAVAHILDTVLPGRVYSEPSELVVGVANFAVIIAPSCSGFEGIGLIAALVVGYLLTFRASLRFPNALLLLPIGIACAWLGNAMRIAGLLVVGAYLDADLAYGGFHSKAGWVFFCAVALGLGAAGQRLPFFTRNAAPRDGSGENPTAAYLMPLLALIAAALVTAAFARSVDLFYGARLLAALSMLFVYRRWYENVELGASRDASLVGFLVAALWIATHPHHPDAEATLHAAFAELPAWSLAAWIFVRAFGSILVIPICEELAFRGWLLRWLVKRDFTRVSARSWTPLALLGSSLAFGVIHQRWLAAALAGTAYAFVQHRSGRLADAIVAHAVTNGVIALWVLGTGDYGLWL